MTGLATHVVWGLDGAAVTSIPMDASSSVLAADIPVHAAGLMNPRWPLCHEAEAVAIGWTRDDILDGELSCCDEEDIQVAGIDVITRFDCRSCRELVHA